LADVVDGFSEGKFELLHGHEDEVGTLTTGLFAVERIQIIAPSHEVIGIYGKPLEDRVMDDFIGKVKAEGKFDEGPDRKESARVSTQLHVHIDIEVVMADTVGDLITCGMSIIVHGLQETLLAAGRCDLSSAYPKVSEYLSRDQI